MLRRLVVARLRGLRSDPSGTRVPPPSRDRCVAVLTVLALIHDATFPRIDRDRRPPFVAPPLRTGFGRMDSARDLASARPEQRAGIDDCAAMCSMMRRSFARTRNRLH